MPKKPRGDPINNLPSSREGFRKSKDFILESLLTPYHFIPTDVEACGLFNGRDLIFRRNQVVNLQSINSWKSKHMRRIKALEKPVRIISKRVGGIDRRIELFSPEQTEPLPVLVASREAGIPSNEFGNVEIDAIPESAVLVETSDIGMGIRVCKTLGILYSRCQKGWKRRAPNYVGIVVLQEDEARVREALAEEISRSEINELKSRNDAALAIWKVLLRRIDAEFYIQTKVH